MDDNQAEIVAGLRKAGISVQPLHTAGNGVPDLIAGTMGVNILLECKDGSKPRSQRQLTDDQILWHATWNGQAAVVETLEEALFVVRQQVEKVCRTTPIRPN